MQLTKAAEYAVFATVHLAENAGKQPMQGKDIALACDFPPAHLLKILQHLVHAKILTSERGALGGFSLNKPISEITLLEIIEAVGGPIIADFSVRKGGPGKQKARQQVEKAYNGVANFARVLFKRTTIEEMIE